MVRSSVKEAYLSFITIAFIFFTAFWLVPDKDRVGDLKKRILEPVRTFWLFWGLEQNWALFSPAIREINYHTVGLITFKDGTKQIWEAPRMDRLNLWEKFRAEKYRKWSIDSLPWPAHKEFWPYIARYIGRQAYDKQNPPVQFSLILFWVKIPPPTESQFVERLKLPAHTSTNHVFTYVYTEEDFR